MAYVKSINRVINLSENLTDISKQNYIKNLTKLFSYLEVKKVGELKKVELALVLGQNSYFQE